MSCVWGFGPDGGSDVLTSKEVAEKTADYAAGKSGVIRDDILRHIMEEAGAPVSRSFRRDKRNFQAFRLTITVTMNHLAGWKQIGAKASPRWERER